MNIAVIAGIRAQFIKLAAFQLAIQRWNDTSNQKINPLYINSGQHYDNELAKSFIKELDINFDVDLTRLHKNKTPINILCNMISGIHQTLADANAVDWVIIFGDANTTLAGAIAASKLLLPVVHVEAGVRVNNIFRLEEQNRVVADHLSVVHFLTAEMDAQNLNQEGLGNQAFWVGDLVYDLVLNLDRNLPSVYGPYGSGEYILATIHREENVNSDEILRNVMYALSNNLRPVILIMHPRTRERLKALKLSTLSGIYYVSVLSYKEMLAAIRGCAFIVTDSGALQRESFYLKKRCLIRQDEVFWSVLTDLGVHHKVGKSLQDITEGIKGMESLIIEKYPSINVFGDGKAGYKILEQLFRLKGKILH